MILPPLEDKACPLEDHAAWRDPQGTASMEGTLFLLLELSRFVCSGFREEAFPRGSAALCLLLLLAAPHYFDIRCILGDIRLWVGDPSTSPSLVSLPRAGTREARLLNNGRTLPRTLTLLDAAVGGNGRPPSPPSLSLPVSLSLSPSLVLSRSLSLSQLEATGMTFEG